MNDRRTFLKASAAAVSLMTFTIVPQANASSFAGYTNIIHTKDNPGRWAGKEAIHVPQVEVIGSKVSLVTEHPMSDAHFIVRHTLVLEDGTFIGAKTFFPADKPESSYELPAGYKGKIFATSFCNLHDFWLNETIV